MLTRNFQAFVLNFTLGTLAKIFPELFAESFKKFPADIAARIFAGYYSMNSPEKFLLL